MKVVSYLPLLGLLAHGLSAMAVPDSAIADRAVVDHAVEGRMNEARGSLETFVCGAACGLAVDRLVGWNGDPHDRNFETCVRSCVNNDRAIELAKQIAFNTAVGAIVPSFVDWVSRIIR